MVLGFNSNPVPGLRKKYDRAREKADKLKEKEKKMRILRLLDQLEPTLIALEEQELPKFEKKKRTAYVKEGVEQAEKILKEKEAKKYSETSK